ncbi:hypothetical protein OCOL_000120 [Ordospora colligata]|uniref:CLASP N-terminal domain-containing protein n=1 Tax=Ordospora colligata OC4 TaxID=1354746 RepID=A0A0B2UKZ1_9MICR|nr:uncharacterized protein M896_050940 [Ordospora colligata OC4]KHN69687.1 hypothetical protein M896_050940 [Ordospora colligata OC4]
MSLSEVIREAGVLYNGKEDENSWSRIDVVLGKLASGIRDVSDAKEVLKVANELVIRSVQSERSKLAGTAMALAKKCVGLCGRGFEYSGVYLMSLMKVCGKSNKIFYSRAEEVIVEICRCADVRAHVRVLSEYSGSQNKNVRLAVFKGIEGMIDNIGMIDGIEGIVEKGRGDPFQEIREVCRRITDKLVSGECRKGEAIEGENVINGMRREPVRMVRKPVRIDSGGVEKKELEVGFSPARKQSKVIGDNCEMVVEEAEISKQKVNEKCMKGEDKEMNGQCSAKKVFSGARRSTVYPEVVNERRGEMRHDDLTPIRLDRYLSKYREEHGNLRDISEGVKHECLNINDNLHASQCEDQIGEQEDNCNHQMRDQESNCLKMDIDEIVNEEKWTAKDLIESYSNGNEFMDNEEESSGIDGDNKADDGMDWCLNEGVSEYVNNEEVDELSRSFANFSIIDSEVREVGNEMNNEVEEECIAQINDVLDESVNPYEFVEEGEKEMDQEYTIVDSAGGMECLEVYEMNKEMPREEKEGDESIHESTILMSIIEEPHKKKSETNKRQLMLSGNRFAGFLEMEEDSGEETVFGKECKKNEEGKEDFTMIDSFIEVKKSVFRKE